MILKKQLVVLINLSIGISLVSAWNPNIQRSYDLERGPVFYEAYYPNTDNNEQLLRNNFEQKRYINRGTVLERSYQIPSDQASPRERVSTSEYINPEVPEFDNNPATKRASNFLQEGSFISRNDFSGPGTRDSGLDDKENDHFPIPLEDMRSLGIKEISSIARRAISRDLENWNMIENYLNHANYQNQAGDYREDIVDPDPSRENFYNKESGLNANPSLRNTPFIDTRDFEPVRRLSNLDVLNRDSLDRFDNHQYLRSNLHEWQPEMLRMRSSRQSNAPDTREQGNLNSYPSENIFEPRPQVIKYIFSEKSPKVTETKGDNLLSTKEVSKESSPRNYGDNLIRDEIKKSDNLKDVKVTSIQVSEMPRHKTRHHHGEWPKRDYSHHNQS